ncbi:hypothetical protein HAX54_005356 [Datura stramonium]|uniref:Uncharacterized protein n=1 Tax=Datura stramonium TaxID=4076 RepID=A0ABS8T9W5_DATST|nr:hypothetical protein [Datura stramonium]
MTPSTSATPLTLFQICQVQQEEPTKATNETPPSTSLKQVHTPHMPPFQNYKAPLPQYHHPPPNYYHPYPYYQSPYKMPSPPHQVPHLTNGKPKLEANEGGNHVPNKSLNSIRCHKCHGFDHYMRDFPNRRIIIALYDVDIKLGESDQREAEGDQENSDSEHDDDNLKRYLKDLYPNDNDFGEFVATCGEPGAYKSVSRLEDGYISDEELEEKKREMAHVRKQKRYTKFRFLLKGHKPFPQPQVDFYFSNNFSPFSPAYWRSN